MGSARDVASGRRICARHAMQPHRCTSRICPRLWVGLALDDSELIKVLTYYCTRLYGRYFDRLVDAMRGFERGIGACSRLYCKTSSKG